MKFALDKLSAESFGLQVTGQVSITVSKIAPLSSADMDCLTYYKGDSIEKAVRIEAGILIAPASFFGQLDNHKATAVVYSDNPKLEFIRIIEKNYSNTFSKLKECDSDSISKQAFVEENVKVGKNSIIFPGVFLQGNVTIGDNCMIQSGTVIGGIGLGHVFNGVEYERFVHLGDVIISDRVDIGNNVSILRGMLESTVIGEGTKIGNNVNIGHGVEIGKHCYISSGVTIGGACTIKDNCWISPGVSISDHIVIEERCKIGVGSVIIKDTLADSFYLGNPARKIS